MHFHAHSQLFYWGGGGGVHLFHWSATWGRDRGSETDQAGGSCKGALPFAIFTYTKMDRSGTYLRWNSCKFADFLFLFVCLFFLHGRGGDPLLKTGTKYVRRGGGVGLYN